MTWSIYLVFRLGRLVTLGECAFCLSARRCQLPVSSEAWLCAGTGSATAWASASSVPKDEHTRRYPFHGRWRVGDLSVGKPNEACVASRWAMALEQSSRTPTRQGDSKAQKRVNCMGSKSAQTAIATSAAAGAAQLSPRPKLLGSSFEE